MRRFSIKKILCSSLTAFLVLAIFSVSIPTHKAEAGSLGRATELTARRNAASNAISATANTASAAGINSLVIKENILDGIGWAIAKQMVSSMTRSLINWINAGFEGSPAFVTDLNAFLLDALDSAAGEYIKGLGGIGEFICSPFQLDIQAALSISYAQARSGQPSGPDAPACKLTDIANNIEGFFAGISNQGWDDWLSVTSNPQNTPYGAYLEAQARLKIKLRNEAGQEIEVASWGDGFLSKKICEGIEGTSAEKCTISTPGQVISEALTFQLSTGPRSLIEADEINELIGALLNQLVLKAMEGINGLLGLSAGTGYTDYTLNGSSTQAYLDDLVDEGTLDTRTIKGQMDASLTSERSYLALTSTTLSETNRRLGLVQASQEAIDELFNGNNSNADAADITRSDTLASARRKVESRLNNDSGGRSQTRLEAVATQLDIIDDALTIIATMTDDTTTREDLLNFSFTRLETEGRAVITELTSLVNEINSIVPQTINNITKLTSMIDRYENATATITRIGTGTSTATTSITIASIRTDIAYEYASLVSGNNLTTPATIEQNRQRWKQKLSL